MRFEHESRPQHHNVFITLYIISVPVHSIAIVKSRVLRSKRAKYKTGYKRGQRKRLWVRSEALDSRCEQAVVVVPELPVVLPGGQV